MTALTIYGVLGDDLWIDRDGDEIALNGKQLESIAEQVFTSRTWTTKYAGHDWTAVDILYISLQIRTAPELDPCTSCRTLPILHGGDRCIECAGLVQEQSDTTMRTWRAS